MFSNRGPPGHSDAAQGGWNASSSFYLDWEGRKMWKIPQNGNCVQQMQKGRECTEEGRGGLG